eukprot:Hpha_TRINITY_DN15850_c1_g10::TRINITY_DN15850_c1_g10_i1::g.192255::m.192255
MPGKKKQAAKKEEAAAAKEAAADPKAAEKTAAKEGAPAELPDPLNETAFPDLNVADRPQPMGLSVSDKMVGWRRFTTHLTAPANRSVFKTFIYHSIAMLVVPVAAFFMVDDILRGQGWGPHDALTAGAVAALAASMLVSLNYVGVAWREEAADRRAEEEAKKTK